MVEIRKIVTTREVVFSKLELKHQGQSCVRSGWR